MKRRVVLRALPLTGTCVIILAGRVLRGIPATAVAVALTCASLRAVPLENWRLPWYRFAVDLEGYESSPSGLFWDDLTGVPSFADRLWPDPERYRLNHWTAEPALHFQAGNEEVPGGEQYFGHGELLSDFRFRNLTVRNFLEVDTRYPHLPATEYPWMKNYPAGGSFEEAYLQADWNFGMLRVGRLKRNWGPFIDRSLLLSNNPFAFDGVEWQAKTSFLEFRHFLGGFPFGTSWRDADSGQKGNRFFTAHALSLMLGRWVSVGFFESMIFSSPGGFPDLQYVNPFSIYFVTNTNGEFPGNLMMGLNWRIRPGIENLTIRGQIALDDFQIVNDELGQEPDHWGYDVEASLRDFLPLSLKHAVRANGRYLSRWMYTVPNHNADVGERYAYLRRSLGTDTVDALGFGVAAIVAGTSWWAGQVGFAYHMRGPNSILSRWNDSSGQLGYTEEPRFSERDSIEHTTNIYVEALGHFRNYADLRIGIHNRWSVIRDQGEKRTDSRKYDPLVTAAVSIHFCDFFLRF